MDSSTNRRADARVTAAASRSMFARSRSGSAFAFHFSAACAGADDQVEARPAIWSMFDELYSASNGRCASRLPPTKPV